MSDRLQELLNRKPMKWGNVTTKEFIRDLSYLQNVVKEQQQEIERLQTIEKAYEAMKKSLSGLRNYAMCIVQGEESCKKEEER